jgi:hypothetical protein
MIGGPHYLSSSPIFGHKDKVGWGTFILPVKLFYLPFITLIITPLYIVTIFINVVKLAKKPIESSKYSSSSQLMPKIA